MITLLGMNTFYILDTRFSGHDLTGVYPVSSLVTTWFGNISAGSAHFLHEVSWWGHILGIFFFANYLPYSKHFHVFMSVPNVFLSNLEPIGKMATMDNITREVKLMLDTEAAYAEPAGNEEENMERFGIFDRCCR